jgi:hypothetical protein
VVEGAGRGREGRRCRFWYCVGSEGRMMGAEVCEGMEGGGSEEGVEGERWSGC